MTTFNTVAIAGSAVIAQYAKAVRIFEEQYPALLALAQEKDAARKAAHDAAVKRAEEAEIRDAVEWDAYYQDLRDWRKKPSWFRGPQPKEPPMRMLHRPWPIDEDLHARTLNRYRDELDRAMKTPGHLQVELTQGQYERMHEWARGDVQEFIQKRFQ